jgi:Putative beta-barrel porin-2, OmpL-like. bbp2
MPVGKFTGGFQLVNGWNNIEDNNSGKTIGLVGNYTEKKWAWNNNYYTGPENSGTNQGWRNLYDTTLLLTPTDKFTAYVNYDYLHNQNPGKNAGGAHVDGIAFAARGQVTELFALAARLEWMNDASGFSTGVTQKVKEFTLTGEIKLKEGLLTRAEYRHDWSNAPFFDRGNDVMSAKTQDTLLIGIVAFFGPKR